jgi:hypothetical protein
MAKQNPNTLAWTPDGKPANQGTSPAKPTDFLTNANGAGDGTPTPDPSTVSRPQQTAEDAEEVERYIPPQDRSRAQQAGPPGYNPASLSKGNPSVQDAPSAAKAGTGSVGNPRRPFKMKGG